MSRPAKSGALAAVDAPDDAPLSKPQRKLVAEALRRAEEARDTMEDALVGFGRWLLVAVFDDDAAAALDDRSDNAVWLDLLHRAGGPTLRLSRKMLYVALHIAARDRRITDESWRNLEPGRKALLLPLGDEAQMRTAAQHVTAMKLTQRATRAYVSSLLLERGKARETRFTAPRLASQVRRFRERVTGRDVERKLAEVVGAAEGPERKAAQKELEALRAWADRLLRRLKST